MFSYFARRAIEAFGRRWNYDVSYMREILADAGVGALLPLNALTKVGTYRRGVPARVYHAAKITASIAADCGPCAQLAVSMAEADGVEPATLRALALGNRQALSPEECLGYDLALATVTRQDAGDARDEIVRRYGRRGLVSLAYAIVAAGAYPAFKYAMGYGHACRRLRVRGDIVSREQLAV